MNENTLIKPLLTQVRAEIEPDGVVLRISDMVTHGIPDFVTVKKTRTVWWEVKFATPRIKSPGIQQLTARRLARHGLCWFIVYQVDRNGENPRTGLVHPANIHEDGTFTWYAVIDGINHQFIIDFIRSMYA